MVISLAYPAWLLSHLTASPYNTVSYDNRALGVRLDLLVNSTHLKPGDGIAITIRESNMRFVPNELQARSNWMIRGLSLGACGTVNTPVGFAIFRGNYTEDNISRASPLQLYKPGTYFCPMILSGISSYIFAPGSDFVDIVGSCSPNPCLRMNVQDQGRFAGSWSELIPPLPSLSIFNQFSPGVYTVAGGDEWGDLLVLNFTVS